MIHSFLDFAIFSLSFLFNNSSYLYFSFLSRKSIHLIKPKTIPPIKENKPNDKQRTYQNCQSFDLHSSSSSNLAKQILSEIIINKILFIIIFFRYKL